MLKKQNMTLEQALELVTKQIALGNYRSAELILVDVLENVPDYFDALHMLGIVKYNLGDLTTAIETLEKAVKLDEVTAECWCNLGSFFAQSGVYDKACYAFDKAIILNPDYPDSYWNKSNALCLDGKYDEAELFGREAVNLTPKRPEAWLNLGMGLVKLGRLTEAVKSWETALKLQPDFAVALNNLGNVFRELGRPIEAKDKCFQALDLEPENVQAMNNLANALFDLGHFDDAKTWYIKAIALKPDYAEAHNNLAICLMQQQCFDEAVVEARYAIAFQKDYAEAYMNMSRALRSMGELEKAEQAIQQAILLYPDSIAIKIELADMLLMSGKDVDAKLIISEIDNMEQATSSVCLRLSSILERVGSVEKAIEAIDKAIELAPQMPENYIRKGQICHMFGYVELAEESYNKAEELQTGNPSLYISMADLCQSKGDIKGAELYARKAQEISPDLPSIYSVLSKIKPFSLKDDDFLKMLELENGIEKRGVEVAAALYFALFSVYENMNNYNKAFSYLEKANNFKAKTAIFNVKNQKNAFTKIKKDYTKATYSNLQGRGCSSDIPVFIIGMPRSGTTLTEQILASHPDVYASGELLDFGNTEQEYGSEMTKDNCVDIGKSYIQKIKQRDIDGMALRITDKMPGNFMRLGQIVSALPNAKIIHCRRDPIDTCLSCYKQNFARGHEWSYKLEDILHYYKKYDDLMDYWRKILPNKFLEINYEDTVNNFESQARELIDYIELDWNDDCLEPHKYKRSVLTSSKLQVIKPIYSSSINSWKYYEDYLHILLEEFKVNSFCDD